MEIDPCKLDDVAMFALFPFAIFIFCLVIGGIFYLFTGHWPEGL